MNRMSLMLKSTAAAQVDEDATAKEFNASLAELEAFVKARGAVDQKKPLEGKDKEEAAAGGEGKEGEGALVTKSATGKEAQTGDGDGKEEVVDGEKVIKQFEETLTKSIAAVQAGVQTAQASTDQVLVVLAKSLQATMNVVATIHDQVQAFGNGGRPRKSLLTVMTKSVGGGEEVKTGLSPNDILSKAVASTLSAAQVGEVRMYIQANQPVPEHLMREIDKVK